MGLKKNGKKVRIMPHESVGSQESLEMDEFSDEDDEVFVRHNRNDSEEAGKPLIKRKKRVILLFFSDGSGTRNPGFGFWKCCEEMGLRQVEQGRLFFIFCEFLGKK